MGEFVIQIVIGIVLIVIGIFNMKGNISSLHSYHRKRVRKEDELSFGKKVGIGTIIIGSTIIVAAIVDLLIEQPFKYIIDMILIGGFVPSLIIIFYALFKYNKGIF